MQDISKSRILIADDNKINLEILEGLLENSYEVHSVLDGKKALEKAHELAPDLILLDIMMPGMDGFEVCQRLKKDEITKQIPIIFLTALSQTKHKTKGFSLGAVDYVAKPFDALEVKARIKTHLQLRKITLELQDQNIILDIKVKERTKEIALTQEATIDSLASLAEYRDPETGGHIQRTKIFVRLLALQLQSHPKFEKQLSDNTIELLEKCAPLHDIGKVGVPDHILLKKGRLTEEEMELMKKHTIFGHRAIMSATKKIGFEVPFLEVSGEIALTHHEKWDGTGYPLGLKGDVIPLSGRLMALADVYDALVSKRVYKLPFSHRETARIITEGDGRTQPEHFDPDVMDAFVKVKDDFLKAALKYADSEEERIALLS